jgi:5'-3' exonuclease
VIATVTRMALEEGLRVVIMSSDKDLLQLVNKRVLVWDVPNKKLYGPPEVEEKFSVRPDQLLDYLSLVGDSGDGVPGVLGVGPVAAVKLIKHFGTAAAAMAAAQRPGADGHVFFGGANLSIWAKLHGRVPQAQLALARQLIDLRRDVPLPITDIEADLLLD